MGSTSVTVTSSSSPVPGGRQLFSNVARLGFAAGCDPPALKMDESARGSSVAAGIFLNSYLAIDIEYLL